MNTTGRNDYVTIDFPYSTIYHPETDEYEKVFLAINSKSFYHELGFNPWVYGGIEKIDVLNNKGTIQFDLNEVRKSSYLTVYYPDINYQYDNYSQESTFIFTAIDSEDIHTFDILEEIEGISNVQVEIIKDNFRDEKRNSIKLTFHVDSNYHLYGDVSDNEDGDIESVATMSLWTELKGEWMSHC